MCLAQGHNTVTPVRLEPASPLSPAKHSTTYTGFEDQTLNIVLMMHCMSQKVISLEVFIGAKQFLCFNNNRSQSNGLAHRN